MGRHAHPDCMNKRQIGLLGGSFNPAHEGHLYISETALRSLGLDEVWWLVSPQNPLKPTDGMASFEDRFNSAKQIARNPKIVVSDFEQHLGQSYTARTLEALCESRKDCAFVWLMGADNLIQFRNWYQWRDIFDTLPIAVFDRPGYTMKALNSFAAKTHEKYRVFTSIPGAPLKDFAMQRAPAWTFVSHTKHKMSSTALRNRINFS